MKSIDSIPEGTVMKPLRGSHEESIKGAQSASDYDPFEHADPVEVFSKYAIIFIIRFPDSWCEKVKAI